MIRPLGTTVGASTSRPSRPSTPPPTEMARGAPLDGQGHSLARLPEEGQRIAGLGSRRCWAIRPHWQLVQACFTMWAMTRARKRRSKILSILQSIRSCRRRETDYRPTIERARRLFRLGPAGRRLSGFRFAERRSFSMRSRDVFVTACCLGLVFRSEMPGDMPHNHEPAPAPGIKPSSITIFISTAASSSNWDGRY